MLTIDDVRRSAPAAFSESHPMTDRYAHVQTSKVLEALMENGYQPVQAGQDRPTRRDPRYVNHRIVMSHDSMLDAKVGADQVPQIYLLNSHNGRTKFRIFAGLYRFVCSNGLVVGRDLFRYEVRHVGDAVAESLGFADTMMTELDKLTGVIGEWSEIEMSEGRQHSFAKDAAVIRFGKERANSYKPQDILQARRTEDEGNVLWKVFNRVQENTVEGEIAGQTANRRAIRSRPLRSINSHTAFNVDLWNLAENYAQAA